MSAVVLDTRALEVIADGNADKRATLLMGDLLFGFRR
jgi:hypothetical protein